MRADVVDFGADEVLYVLRMLAVGSKSPWSGLVNDDEGDDGE